MYVSMTIRNHVGRNSVYGTRNLVEENKRQTGSKGTTSTILGPTSSDCQRKKQVQVVDNAPTDLFNHATDSDENCRVRIDHRNRLADTDHQSGCRHNSDNDHQTFAEFLPKFEAEDLFD